MDKENAITFTGMTLDRATDKRKSSAWFAQQLTNLNSRFYVIHKGKYCFRERTVIQLTAQQLASLAVTTQPNFVLLGMENEQAIIVADFSAYSAEDVLISLKKLGYQQVQWIDFRFSVGWLSHAIAAQLAYGRALTHWHTAYRYCGFCGCQTQSHEAGHMRKCQNENCQKVHFPRTDPVVIMLVEYQPKSGPALCLLANHTRSPENLVSTLAGFVDPGESLEEAVIREVKEEAGLTVRSLRYCASQPWPFPNSLMLGFHATVTDKELTLDKEELTSANWYSAEQIKRFDDWGTENNNIQIPRKESIARYLINGWLDQQSA